jgi:membrane-associated phospholipid phosphatase
MRSFATGVTKILNPLTTILATMFVAVLIQQMPASQKILWLALGIIATAAPTVILYLQYKRREISSLWSPTAIERQKSFLAWVIVTATYSALAFWLDAPRLILALGLVLLGLGLVNLLLSQGLKISVHTEATTLLALVAILAVSVAQIYLVILITLVGWSRLYLRAHNFSEVSLGALMAILVTYFVFSFFGLATF